MARQSKILSPRDLQIVIDNLAGIPIALSFVLKKTNYTTHHSLQHVNSCAVMLGKGGRRFG